MQNTLEEERRYSSQLQREVDQFSEDVQRTTNKLSSNHETISQRSQLLEEEKALLETQITALEEGKRLCKLNVIYYILDLTNDKKNMNNSIALGLKLIVNCISVIVSAEVGELKSSLEQTQHKLDENKMLLKVSMDKESAAITENNSMRATLDELKVQNQVKEEKIKILNTVVEQRYI